MINDNDDANPNYLPMVAGRYYFTPNATSTSTSNTSGNTNLRLVPHYIPNPITITRIGIEVTAIGDAGSKYRLGIYEDGGGRPARLVIDAGQINGDSATIQELTISVTIGPGWYWFGGVVQSAPTTQPTIRVGTPVLTIADVGSAIPGVSATGIGSLQSGVSGALPATFTFTSGSGQCPRIFIKL